MNRKQRRQKIKQLAKTMTKVKGELNINMPSESDFKFLVKRYKNEIRIRKNK